MTRSAWWLRELSAQGAPGDPTVIPAGQGVVDLTQEISVREVMLRMQTEYLDTMERHSRIGVDA